MIGGAETWQVYGFEGELVAEYNVSGTFSGGNPPAATSPAKEYGYRNGKLLVVWDASQSGNAAFRWLVMDHLGSTRMEADLSGSLTTLKRHDYLPFGEELVATTGAQRGGIGYEPPASNIRQKFGSKERDTETGLDFFEARYFASAQGRFISPDEFKGGPDGLSYFANDASANPTFYADIRNPQSLNKYQFTY